MLIIFILLLMHSLLVYFFGRRVYETLIKFHLLVALSSIILLRTHVSQVGHDDSKLLAQTCLAILAIYLVGLVFHGIWIIYRNLSISAMTKIVLPRKDDKILDAVSITVVLPYRTWKARPGQYIYLWFPQLG